MLASASSRLTMVQHHYFVFKTREWQRFWTQAQTCSISITLRPVDQKSTTLGRKGSNTHLGQSRRGAKLKAFLSVRAVHWVVAEVGGELPQTSACLKTKSLNSFCLPQPESIQLLWAVCDIVHSNLQGRRSWCSSMQIPAANSPSLHTVICNTFQKSGHTFSNIRCSLAQE